MLFRIAFANIWRRPFRAVFTACGVALGIGAFIALVGFADTFEEQWRRFYLTKGTDICVLRGSLLNKASMDEVLVEKLRDLPIVAGATPVSFDLVDFSQDVSAVAQGWVDTSFEFESLTVFEGRRFRGDEAGIMLGEILANSLGKKVGVFRSDPFVTCERNGHDVFLPACESHEADKFVVVPLANAGEYRRRVVFPSLDRLELVMPK